MNLKITGKITNNMKTLDKIGWLIAYIVILFGFHIFATMAFMQNLDVIAWPMVIGGALTFGACGYYMIMDMIKPNE